MIVQRNLASYKIFVNYESALQAQSSAMAKISSGLRVNSAKDDPYAVAQDNTFNMQIKALQRTNENAQDDISLVQTSSSGLNNITNMLQRIQQLAVQAGNSTNTSSDISDMQSEVSTLVNGIDSIAKNTNINDVHLLDGSNTGSLQSQIGANNKDTVSIPTYDFTANGLGLNSLNLTAAGGPSATINAVNTALATIRSANSNYGSIENRLNTSISNNTALNTDEQTGDSNVMDADVASEMMEYSKQSVLVQAGIAMMAQTNNFPQQVLNILSKVK
jgi:flagellin